MKDLLGRDLAVGDYITFKYYSSVPSEIDEIDIDWLEVYDYINNPVPSVIVEIDIDWPAIKCRALNRSRGNWVNPDHVYRIEPEDALAMVLRGNI